MLILLDDEFIQTHTVGFDELRRDVLNSEWKDIERISGLSQTQIAELAVHFPRRLLPHTRQSLSS